MEARCFGRPGDWARINEEVFCRQNGISQLPTRTESLPLPIDLHSGRYRESRQHAHAPA